ncbi:uncharacterized protein BX663DRAFT_505279, partial [Cokeromyces recurvatus]|uniref:uncharacterized protein n=1 Tax=Cokeromyces recurvatus TaxID=90255 RepID=UPI00221F399D
YNVFSFLHDLFCYLVHVSAFKFVMIKKKQFIHWLFLYHSFHWMKHLVIVSLQF